MIAVALLLAACSSKSPLLRDSPWQGQVATAQPPLAPGSQAPAPATSNPLALPPQETFEVAGPNAHNELDYETLEGPGAVELSNSDIDAAIAADKAAQAGEPPPADDGGQQQVAAADSKPPEKPLPGQTVINAVAVPGVSGSPGRGNEELTSAMRRVLKDAGWPVLNASRKDALTINGKVELGTPTQGRQMVRLSWVVADPSGRVLGNVKQENVVPEGALDTGWGENTDAATAAAAEGIFNLIQRHR